MTIFDRHYYATHPDMMAAATNQQLRDRYFVGGLFRPGQCTLVYTHADRFVLGGVLVGSSPVALPAQTEPESAAGHPFLERRELAAINVGDTPAEISVDGQVHVLARHDCLYITMGAADVRFSGAGAALYLVSSPAHRAFATRKLSIADAIRLERGSMEEANRRSIYQLVIPGVCDSAQLVVGLTILEPGSVWNTMPPHIHERRSEVYFYLDLEREQRIMHFMGQGEATRHLILADREAVISPPWSIHMGVGTKAYSFIWAMAGENQDYGDMNVLDICQLR